MQRNLLVLSVPARSMPPLSAAANVTISVADELMHACPGNGPFQLLALTSTRADLPEPERFCNSSLQNKRIQRKHEGSARFSKV
jgi:hypothetical protein